MSNIGKSLGKMLLPIGAAYSSTTHPQNTNLPILFQPFTIRNTTFKNRIFVAPMCQYSSEDGYVNDWHMVHIGAFATRGFGGVTMEATAVLPEGRISPQDAGIWKDSHIEPLRKIVDFAHAHGTPLGIQLAHAGRKASTLSPFIYQGRSRTDRNTSWVAEEKEGGWPNNVYAPSAIKFADNYPKPKAMTEKDLKDVEDAFAAAAERAQKAGFDFIEIHAAHGYLINEFLSPLSNTRTDSYGGQSLENRMRFPLRVIKRIRQVWLDKPLFVRIIGTEWADGEEKDKNGLWRNWGIEQSTIFAGEMKKLGVDLVHMTSGGNWEKQKIDVKPGYQIHLAEAIKKAHPDVLVGGVGAITTGAQAESYLQEKKADVIFLAREVIRDPSFVMRSALEMGVAINTAAQYSAGWIPLLIPKSKI